MKSDATRWEATRTPGLYVRQPGGGFYARVTINGKRSWRSLKTDKLKEAKTALAELQTGRARPVARRVDMTLHAALDQVMEFRKVRRGIDRPLKKSTGLYHLDILSTTKRLFADRPLGLFGVRGIMEVIQATGFSQSRRKAIFELLKAAFKEAAENGVIDKNPLSGHVPGQTPIKDRVLPTREQLDQIVEIIPQLFPRYGKKAALGVRFLAFSGMRLNEARSVLGKDISGGKIRIRGAEEGTKTGKIRVLDINPPLQLVLDDIAAVFGTKPEQPVMPIREVIRQLAAACENLGLPVINQHDLRAWFITWCIVGGVDISTLSDWVGNSPKVLLERYAAVQDEQKKAAASKLV